MIIFIIVKKSISNTFVFDFFFTRNVWEFIANAVSDINNLTNAVNRHLDRAADLLKSPPPLR